MNKMQASYLSLFVAVLYALAGMAMLFFVATDSKSTKVFLGDSRK